MTALEPGAVAVTATCPSCGADRIVGATFCEACAFEFSDAGQAPSGSLPGAAAVGEESPLDVGWTGAVAAEGPTGGAATGVRDPAEALGAACRSCGEGRYEDGYCNHCGAKAPDPRDHYEEAPASWVAGACDIGRRHRRNEDALALAADEPALSFAALVVCDGVSNSTDSHIASLAASRAARAVLREPLSRGVGTRSAVVAAAAHRLDEAVRAAQAAVVSTSTAAGEAAVDSPPSCTFVAALVLAGTAVVGNVGDSRAYWVPDAPEAAARQLGEDDSFAAAQMSAGVPRHEAETSPGAHAITRWLGVDAPDDLTPHTADLDLTDDGWLVVCSDGLWNYWSAADDLGGLVHETVAALGAAGLHPPTLARALVDRANAAGGSDNITVALARVGGVAAAPVTVAEPGAPTRTLEGVGSALGVPGAGASAGPPAALPPTARAVEHPTIDASPDPKDTP